MAYYRDARVRPARDQWPMRCLFVCVAGLGDGHVCGARHRRRRDLPAVLPCTDSGERSLTVALHHLHLARSARWHLDRRPAFCPKLHQHLLELKQQQQLQQLQECAQLQQLQQLQAMCQPHYGAPFPGMPLAPPMPPIMGAFGPRGATPLHPYLNTAESAGALAQIYNPMAPADPQDQFYASGERKRNRSACTYCHERKLRCIMLQCGSCQLCIDKGLQCIPRVEHKRQRFEEIISTVPVLKSMEQYERTVLADAFEEEFFPQGTEIVREGEMGDKFYILLEGECSAIQEDTGGQQTEVLHYEQGGHFGELALLRDTNRQATVKAVTDVRCVMLDKTAFERLLGPVKDILARDAANYAQHL